jgi:hypothetical protein
MAAWFPWVLQPGANVIRWALLSPEARLQILDWHDAAADFTALLRYAVAKDPARSDLRTLIADVCADPTVRGAVDHLDRHGTVRRRTPLPPHPARPRVGRHPARPCLVDHRADQVRVAARWSAAR